MTWYGRAPSVIVGLLLVAGGVGCVEVATGADQGSLPYDRFESPDVCAECHVHFARQYASALMSRCFTHAWDEIEYFKLALPHARQEAKVAEVEAGCNGCHAPLAYLAGDIPPQRPEAGSRANESVTCEVCHAITGFAGEIPHNFNWTIAPGATKQGSRAGLVSDYHEIAVNPFLHTSEFCGTCHNEKDPYGQWVKATQIEWKDGPYGRAGILCQDCHMTPGPGALTDGGTVHADARQHLFQGAHVPGRLAGAVEVLLFPAQDQVSPGRQLHLDARVINAKAGHMIPSGSAEERVVWLHVEAADAEGRVFQLPVDPKGFSGEEMTIASAEAMAYQDIGDIMTLPDFPGLKRDGQVPAGDRIYRLPYLDPDGNMTIAQWHTASFGPDYRLPPLEAVPESFTWTLPADCAPGELTITATVNYALLVASVADFLGVPASEREPVVMGSASAVVMVE